MSTHKSNGILSGQFQRPTVNTLIKKFGMALAILIILAALLSSLFRALTPFAKEYKGEVEQHLSGLLGQPVHIKTMETGWYWFAPVLKLQSVSLKGSNKNPVKLDTIMLGFNLWSSLWHWQIQPGVLYIDKVNLILRHKKGTWHFEGLGETRSANTLTDEMGKHLLALLLQQDKLVIRNVSVDMFSDTGTLLPLRDINLVLVRHGNHFRLRGHARLGSASASGFKLMADMELHPERMVKTAGQIYVAAKNLQYSQWKSFFPELSHWLHTLDGNIELWVDVEKGQIQSVQSAIAADQLTFKGQTLDYFKANMAWKPNASGWILTADDIQLLTAGKVWPQNKLLIEHDTSRKSWIIYLKNLEMEAISDIYPDFKKILEDWKAVGLHGLLTDLQLRLEGSKLLYVLSRFDQVGWNHLKDLPTVDNISGVLQYQPEGGRLELDSEQVHLQSSYLPKQFFSIVNGAINWKKLESGLYDLFIERLELSKPDLALSAKGSFTGIGPDESGYRDLAIDFSAKDAQQWLPWIPSKGLRAELNHWLKNDLKRIGVMSGTMLLEGKARDFPFDNTPGKFTVQSHWSDVDLSIVSGFPLMKNVDVDLELDKRALKATLSHASLSGVPVQDLDLSIDDIGNDKEILFLQGKITDEAENIQAMLRTTTLAKKPFLNNFTVQGIVNLILHFEIPLYPESSGLRLNGQLLFDNNGLSTKGTLGNIQLSNLQGLLHFNDQGLQTSTLTASLYDSPVNIDISTLSKPEKATDMTFKGSLNMDNLKNHVDHPLIRKFTGATAALLRIRLNKVNNLESMQLSSSLEGLHIALPVPLGKTANQSIPFKLNALFKTKNILNMQAGYGNALRADLIFTEKALHYQFDSGVLRIGDTHAAHEKRSGLQIVGTIPEFDVAVWRKLMNQLAGTSSTNWAQFIGNVRVRIKKFVYEQQIISDLALHIKPVKAPQWSLIIKQKDIDAHLTWNPATRSLSGYFTHLHIAAAQPSFTKKLDIAPKEIPNLNLRLDNMEYGTFKPGNITISTKSTEKGMEISYCKIQGPGYVVNAQGTWQGSGKKQQSDIQASVEFSNLAKTLEHWNITPVVDASKGQATFKAQWAAPLYNFSWGIADGQLSLMLRHGRITDLSKETEQKLGLGKLLSILSLQTIPRRLTLDFSDLSGTGYSFDIFKGNFLMNKGILHTEDSYIDGPVAYASMKGNLNLVQRLYDVELKVSPHITASLPVVATLAGGPIAGVAALVAGKIINQGMQQISGYTYRVTGPWSQPVVQQISIMKNRKQVVPKITEQPVSAE